MLPYNPERLSIRDVIVDFLGALVPGFVLLVAVCGVFIWPIIGSANEINAVIAKAGIESAYLPGGGKNETAKKQDAGYIAKLCESQWLLSAVFVLLLSYIIGHLFYRQSPKTPDQASFNRIKSEVLGDENNKWVCKKVDECEFPYFNLRDYLNTRGLQHLLPLVPWPAKEEEKIKRTKNFINILKIRIGFYVPFKSGILARNEAHVRLMSTTWYSSKALLKISIAGLVVTLLIAGASVFFKENSWLGYLPYAIVPLLGIIACKATSTIIEKFLHYQRVREIIFVLETAYTTFRDQPEAVNDICPDFEKVPSGFSLETVMKGNQPD